MSIPYVQTDSLSEQGYVWETLQKRPLFFSQQRWKLSFYKSRVSQASIIFAHDIGYCWRCLCLSPLLLGSFFKKYLLPTTFNSFGVNCH